MTTTLGPLGRRVAILATGAGLAQLVPTLAYPLLARVYSPAEYGTFTILVSVGAILTVVAAGRYHMAIMLPAAEADAVRLASLALVFSSVVSVVMLVPIFFLRGQAGRLEPLAESSQWLLVVPLMVFLGSAFETLSYFSMRRDRYVDVTRAGVIKAFVASLAQIGLGVAGMGVAGLVTGNLASLATANARLLRTYRNAARPVGCDLARYRDLAGRYKDFPKYDLWSSLANALSYNLAVFGFATLYTSATVGSYALAYRIVVLPVTLVGTAISQVYFREAARRTHSTMAALHAFDRVVKVLVAVSLPPFAVLLLFSDALFATFLGETWRYAGSLAAALVPLMWARFVSSPLSTVYLVYGKQRALLCWQIGILSLTMVSFLLGHLYAWTPKHLLSIQSLALAVSYALLLVGARRVVQGAGRRSGAD
ncbi:lipopolysaccharide biosynthesis protein [Actinopolymorpha pittospori]|uniref:O-antigen/teichoic acid export membrane protein n=1 Tax=Actinopolymorpha pittospori TaxID=648752 RepID=A0A927R5H0_9ACTN|nr:O-antigen/teichoic acid export membrane protein [Actinopolymorpha pittospori]